MKYQATKGRNAFWTPAVLFAVLLLAAFGASCSGLKEERSEAFLAETAPPRKQEFRWSNGKAPRSIDPAKAAAAPETDIVRALFEGLTELDPRSLEAMPAAAESWQASDDNRTWTFRIRPNAKWTNGDAVTADDFVRSWKRAVAAKDGSPHQRLFSNIEGLRPPEKIGEKPRAPNSVSTLATISAPLAQNAEEPANKPAATPKPETGDVSGIKAIDAATLEVTLVEPNDSFAKLVAHPIFRPVHSSSNDLSIEAAGKDTVTNGPFRLVSATSEGVVLERSAAFWNAEKVKLERVVFVPADSGEKALEEYRAGRVDAVTNAEFSPVALKLLQQYRDFDRTTYAALNLYELNLQNELFRDRRIREALAISIERERLTEGELEGTTQPALSYLPFGSSPKRKLIQDRQRARDLLKDAGYPEGRNFPDITLTVNRNDTQQRIARSVASMWKENLNIEVDVVVKEAAEVEQDRESGNYDIARRGVVLPSADEDTNMRAIFGRKYSSDEPETDESASNSNAAQSAQAVNTRAANTANAANTAAGTVPASEPGEYRIHSEEDALFDMTAIPLYFPSSYSLVKPYVIGFELNGLDAPLLTEVYIDADWQPTQDESGS